MNKEQYKLAKKQLQEEYKAYKASIEATMPKVSVFAKISYSLDKAKLKVYSGFAKKSEELKWKLENPKEYEILEIGEELSKSLDKVEKKLAKGKHHEGMIVDLQMLMMSAGLIKAESRNLQISNSFEKIISRALSLTTQVQEKLDKAKVETRSDKNEQSQAIATANVMAILEEALNHHEEEAKQLVPVDTDASKTEVEGSN